MIFNLFGEVIAFGGDVESGEVGERSGAELGEVHFAGCGYRNKDPAFIDKVASTANDGSGEDAEGFVGEQVAEDIFAEDDAFRGGGAGEVTMGAVIDGPASGVVGGPSVDKGAENLPPLVRGEFVSGDQHGYLLWFMGFRLHQFTFTGS